jgi:catechol-2,3-dioxygenase
MIRYGLIRSRYDRDPSLIPVVESNMAQYSDDLRLNALTTLSIFYGKYIGLDDWVKYRSKSSFGSHGNYFNTNCANFNLTKTGDLNESNIQLLNLCIRQKARKGESFQLKNIESAGWIGLPLKSFQKRIVEEVFQIEKN